MSEELKACPFCGSVASDPRESEVYQDCVKCDDCGYHLETDIYNTRPIEDGLRAKLEAVAAAGLRDTKLAMSLYGERENLRAELEQARAENARLREALEDTTALLQESIDPGDFTAPEDIDVLCLCEFWGYGAIMNSAARLYKARDQNGAFTVGNCIVVVKNAIEKARAALAGDAQ